MHRPSPGRAAVAGWLATLAASWMPQFAGDAKAGDLRQAEVDLAHFAFASQLGSGIYTVSGRTLQIYRLPLAWEAIEPQDGRPGLRLRLPSTIGLYDFQARDMIDSGLPDRLDTFSVALGAELDFALGDWHLLPYAEAGRAWDSGGNADATVYSASLHLRRDLARDDLLLRLNTGMVYAGVDLDRRAGQADMVKFEAAVESRRLLDVGLYGQPVDGGPYLLVEWYPDRPDETLVRSLDSGSLPLQAELGYTFGTRPRLKLWGLPLPRIGIAYRFGEGLQVYRLVLGAPF